MRRVMKTDMKKTRSTKDQTKFYTSWGFPMLLSAKHRNGEDFEAELIPKSPTKNQRGVSLLISIMAITLMIGVVSDMIVSTSVNLELAIKTKNKVKAEYLGKSGVNFGIYLLSVSYLWDHALASGLMGKAKEPVDGPGSIWTILNSWPPIGKGTVEMMKLAASAEDDPFKLQGVMNEKVATMMGYFEDQFKVSIEDESSKINLSDCQYGSRGGCPEVRKQLELLFSCPVEKAFLEKKNLTPEEMAHRIKDFIVDSEKFSTESNIGSKDGPYEKYTPPYESKRTPFDTINELMLVEGWDDDMHAVFAPYLTVYPYRYRSGRAKEKIFQINLNTAKKELLHCLFPESLTVDCRKRLNDEMAKLKEKGQNVSEEAKSIKKKLKSMYCYGESSQADSSPKKEDWFKVHSNVYRIIVDSQTGEYEGRMEVVIRRVDSGIKEDLLTKREIKRAYQILYWKMI